MGPTNLAPDSPRLFAPGDRVRVTAAGIFTGLVGRVVDPAPEFPAAVMVRLTAGRREIDVGFHPGHLEPAAQ